MDSFDLEENKSSSAIENPNNPKLPILFTALSSVSLCSKALVQAFLLPLYYILLLEENDCSVTSTFASDAISGNFDIIFKNKSSQHPFF